MFVISTALNTGTSRVREKPAATVVFNSERIDAHCGRTPFRITHGLASHPLLSVKRLAGLAASLPGRSVDWNRGQLSIDHDAREPAKNGLSPLQTVLRIASCNSWIAFRDIGRERDFEPLVSELIEVAGGALSARGIQMIQPRCDIYLSSPHAVTPCHVDQHHSFLMQIEGQKTISIFDRDDREALPARRLERGAAKGERGMKLLRRYAHHAQGEDITPGGGLHLPARAPHYVRNGASLSISLSLTFRTLAADRERGVLSVNHRLRQIGLKPRHPGSSSLTDSMKLAAFRGLGGTHWVLRKS